MHAAQHYNRQTNFAAEETDRIGNGFRHASELDHEQDEADVHQIKSNYQQVAGRSGQMLLVTEAIDQKYLAILGRGAGNPNGHAEGKNEV